MKVAHCLLHTKLPLAVAVLLLQGFQLTHIGRTTQETRKIIVTVDEYYHPL